VNKVILIFASCVIAAAPVNAEDSWWKKGADFIKAVNSNKQEASVTESVTSALGAEDIASAFKQALSIGSENVIKQLATVDGFNSDPAIRIPLPKQLDQVKSVLGKVGLSPIVDDFELKMNRAAEAATPKAKQLFLDAIKEMSFDDVKQIYNGPDNSATLYFKEKMHAPLSAEMRPIVEKSLGEVGVIDAYEGVMEKYKALPFVPDVKANLTDQVLNKGIDGIFYYLAKEEAAIRKDPVKQTTHLLKKVFGVGE